MNSSTDGIELKFEYTPTLRSESHCIQNVRNLMVCKASARCFSPITEGIFSPGVSPIFGPDDSPVAQNCDKEDQKPAFKFPKPINSKVNSMSNNSPVVGTQQQNTAGSDFKSTNGNASFELDLSTSTKLENSLETSSRSETSTISNVLDRTMDVTALLKSIGLGAYSEMFAKAEVDLDTFLKITPTDLKRLGFKSEEDCNAIIEMLKIFN